MAEEPSWKASTIYIEPIAKLFRALDLNKSHTRLIVTADGVKATSIPTSKTHAAQLFLASELFASYNVTEYEANINEFTAQLSVSALVHCLQMFVRWSVDDQIEVNGRVNDESELRRRSNNSACFIEFLPQKSFKLQYASESMSSQCELTLYDDVENGFIEDLGFDVNNISLQAIMPSSVLNEVFKELSKISTKEISLKLQTGLGGAQIVITSHGDLVVAEYGLPNDPKILEVLAMEDESADIDFVYDFNSVVESRDGLKISKKTSLRIDVNGVLSLQCLCNVDEQVVYLEYRYLPKHSV